MYVEPDRFFHLTYCTNIHPGNGWSEVYANLRRYVPALKARFAPHNAFSIGLRLSGRESRELLQGDQLQQFQDFLMALMLHFLVEGQHNRFLGRKVVIGAAQSHARFLGNVAHGGLLKAFFAKEFQRGLVDALAGLFRPWRNAWFHGGIHRK